MLLNQLYMPISGPGGSAFPPHITSQVQPIQATGGQSAQHKSGGFMMQSHIVLLTEPHINFSSLSLGVHPFASCRVAVSLTMKTADNQNIVRFNTSAKCNVSLSLPGASVVRAFVTSFSEQEYEHVEYLSGGGEQLPEIVSHPAMDPISATQFRFPGAAGFLDYSSGVGNTAYGLNSPLSGSQFGEINGYLDHANFVVFSSAYRVFLPVGAKCEATLAVTDTVVSYSGYNAMLMPARSVPATTANTQYVGHIRAVGGRAAIRPSANFNWTAGEELDVAFTDTSIDLDGTIATRAWSFYPGATATGTPGTSTDVNPVHVYETEGQKLARLIVTDNDGAISEATDKLVSPQEPATPLDTFLDPAGILFSAANEGTGVRVSKFPTEAVSSRQLLALVPNAKNPSLFQKKSGEIVLGATNRTSGDFERRVSQDSGRSFA